MKSKGTAVEIFINECSLHGQYQSSKEFENAVRNFMAVFKLIGQKRKNDLNAELYKDVFLDFQAIKNEPFQKSLNQIKDQSLKQAFVGLIFNTINPQNWRDDSKLKEVDKYHLVENNQDVGNTSIAEIAERTLLSSEQSYLLINFLASCFQNSHPNFSLCRFISVTKNQTQTIYLDCLDNKAAFEEWVKDKLDERDFLARNTDRFERADKQYHGAPVYIEHKTKKCWYLDNLHKDHYEVFDSNGSHVGEANLDGVIDITKKDKKKKFKF